MSWIMEQWKILRDKLDAQMALSQKFELSMRAHHDKVMQVVKRTFEQMEKEGFRPLESSFKVMDYMAPGSGIVDEDSVGWKLDVKQYEVPHETMVAVRPGWVMWKPSGMVTVRMAMRGDFEDVPYLVSSVGLDDLVLTRADQNSWAPTNLRIYWGRELGKPYDPLEAPEIPPKGKVTIDQEYYHDLLRKENELVEIHRKEAVNEERTMMDLLKRLNDELDRLRVAVKVAETKKKREWPLTVETALARFDEAMEEDQVLRARRNSLREKYKKALVKMIEDQPVKKTIAWDSKGPIQEEKYFEAESGKVLDLVTVKVPPGSLIWTPGMQVTADFPDMTRLEYYVKILDDGSVYLQDSAKHHPYPSGLQLRNHNFQSRAVAGEGMLKQMQEKPFTKSEASPISQKEMLELMDMIGQDPAFAVNQKIEAYFSDEEPGLATDPMMYRVVSIGNGWISMVAYDRRPPYPYYLNFRPGLIPFNFNESRFAQQSKFMEKIRVKIEEGVTRRFMEEKARLEEVYSRKFAAMVADRINNKD